MTPEAILTGHVESVVCVDVSASLGLIVSGAKCEPHGRVIQNEVYVDLNLHVLLCRWSLPSSQYRW